MPILGINELFILANAGINRCEYVAWAYDVEIVTQALYAIGQFSLVCIHI